MLESVFAIPSAKLSSGVSFPESAYIIPYIILFCFQVPKQYLAPGTVVEDVTTGCRGCATGAGGNKNIFGNKYGQYLAAIQVKLVVIS